MECLKCGDTGIKLNGKPCDCGAYTEDKKMVSPEELYIPEMYRGFSDVVGVNEIIVGEMNKKRTVQHFITRFVDSLLLEGHPTLFVDLSDTTLGAYELYYAVLEKIINIVGDLPEDISSRIKVNHLDEPLLLNSDLKLKEGRPLKECYNYLISDFPITKYPTLSNFMKIVQPMDAQFPSKYPLNMYHVKIKSIYGGM